MEVVDKRQVDFLTHYLDPKSETFSNALQSALKAGYAQEYAENITHLMPQWLSEAIGSEQLLQKAEKNLNKFLDMDSKPQIQADITKFVAERLGKRKYAMRTENINVELPAPLLENLKK